MQPSINEKLVGLSTKEYASYPVLICIGKIITYLNKVEEKYNFLKGHYITEQTET